MGFTKQRLILVPNSSSTLAAAPASAYTSSEATVLADDRAKPGKAPKNRQVACRT
jgi:hypothetical protein